MHFMYAFAFKLKNQINFKNKIDFVWIKNDTKTKSRTREERILQFSHQNSRGKLHVLQAF